MKHCPSCFFDCAGFGSKNITLEDSKKKDARISVDDENKFSRKMLKAK